MDRLTSANKHSYSTMPGSHRSDAGPSFFGYPHSTRAPPDEHYSNHEHPAQRRRIDAPSTLRPHFPGDGLDFRRPVMSAPGRDGSSGFDMNYEPEDPIDLTGEGLEQTPNIHLSYTATSSHRASDAGTADAPSSSSRAQRLPRFQRDIIDLAESDEEEQAQPQQQPQNRRIFGYPVDLNSLFPMRADLGRPDFDSQPSSNMDHNDVEFVSSRPLSRVSSRRPTPTRGSSRPDPAVRNTNNAGNTTIDLTADDDEDDDVIHTDTRALPSVNGDRPAMAGSGIGTRDPPALGPGLGRLVRHIRARGPGLPPYLFGHHPGGPEEALARVRAHQAETEQRLQRSRERAQTLQEHVDRHHANTARDRADPPPRPRPRGVNIINMDMDYGLVGFDLGFGVAPIRPPTPKYEPPPPVEKGFTRSPEEDEEVVCPNCGDELALGSGEVKQQVYVIKACGHAYCGECAKRERKSASKKGKGKALDPSSPPPLKKCVVVGCEKSASKRDMIHVYMSS